MELFIRRITEPKLLAIFLRFLFTEMHDQDTIIDIMVHRLTLQSQVSKTFTLQFSASQNLREINFDKLRSRKFILRNFLRKNDQEDFSAIYI